MFNEKFNILLKTLGITSREFSDFMQCDRSYINRIRAGGRPLGRNSRAAVRMAHGIFEYTKKHGCLDKLCLSVGCPAETDENQLSQALDDWLFEGESEAARQSDNKQAVRKTSRSSGFSEKFCAAMKLSGLSNIRLSKLINVDASLVSRWRTGLAVPRDDSMRTALCSELIKRIYTQEQLGSLARIMSVTADDLKDIDSSTAIFKSWLFKDQTKENTIVESLLAGLDSIHFEGSIPTLPFDKAVSAEELDDSADTYIGIDGLRRAVLRFLGNAVRERTGELLLYSDQNIDWMTGDKQFLLKWFSLMSEVLKNGTKIKIIHNIDRGIDEMTAAIKSWLPLYMTGNISSYYSKRPNGSRFSNTLFLAPGRACIYSSHAAGNEISAKYAYHTDNRQLDDDAVLYAQLMQDCRELIKLKFYNGEKRYDQSIDEKNGVYVMQNTLSLGSMPEDLAKKLSERLNADDRTAFMQEWMLQSERYHTNIENGYVCEFIPLPSDEQLFGNTAGIDTVLDGLYYTPEDYAMHISHIISLAEAHKNYTFIPMPDSLLSESRLIIGEKSIIINHLTAPRVDFIIDHPLMRAAFAVYTENLMNQYCMSKNAVIKILHRYI